MGIWSFVSTKMFVNQRDAEMHHIKDLSLCCVGLLVQLLLSVLLFIFCGAGNVFLGVTAQAKHNKRPFEPLFPFPDNT